MENLSFSNMRSALYITLLLLACCFNAPAQNSWTQKADFGGGPRTSAVGFSIGTGGYIGTGYDSTSFRRSFWVYIQSSNTWQQVESMGGSTGSGLSRDMASAFVIGNKAYVGLGQGGNPFLNDIWEYDAGSDVWTQKANFGGTPRRGAAAFAINNKGYIGTGQDASGMKKDLWEYDPAANTWAQKANFGGTPRRLAVGFAIGSLGYIATGDDGVNKSDMWAYDPVANIWTQKASFGSTARNGAAAFVVNGKAYVGTGYDISLNNRNDIWQYDPNVNTWMQVASFSGTARANAVAFAIGSKGYIGTGYDGTTRGDFWEFGPPVGIEDAAVKHSLNIYPNPVQISAVISITPALKTKGSLVLYDLNGVKVKEQEVEGSAVTIERNGLASGIYLYGLLSGNTPVAAGKIVFE
jgi:N-acetylneuraminic acid mutarotase